MYPTPPPPPPQRTIPSLEPLLSCHSCPTESEFLNLALRAVNDGLWDWRIDTGEIFFWPRWKEMFGYTEAELDNTFHGWQSLIHPDDLGIWLHAWMDYMNGAVEDFTVEYRLRAHDGSWHWVLCRGVGNRDEQGVISRIAGCHTDITPLKEHQLHLEREVRLRTLELKRANKKLKKLSHKDYLTGIWNRCAFDESMLREWKRVLRRGGVISVIMADIDYFKGINDDFGHQNGDACLKWVADIMRSQAMRPADAVFRYGGEEFVALLPDTGLVGATKVAEYIRDKIAHSPPPPGITRQCTVSLGVATCTSTCPNNWQTLVALADTMLYHAKRNGRNRVSSQEWSDEA